MELPHRQNRERTIMRVLIIHDEPLAQPALASILATSSDAEGCEVSSHAMEAPDKSEKRANHVLPLATPEVPGSGLRDRVKENGHQQLLRFSQRHSSRIAIKANGRIVFIDPRDVVAVEAEGNYVSLQRRSDSYLLRESISSMAEKLKLYGFIRIHRSVLVNSSFVEHIQSRLTGAYGLRIKGGREYTVTRTYKSNLKSLAAVWIGIDIFLNE
jgi:hypothetical protein